MYAPLITILTQCAILKYNISLTTTTTTTTTTNYNNNNTNTNNNNNNQPMMMKMKRKMRGHMPAQGMSETRVKMTHTLVMYSSI